MKPVKLGALLCASALLNLALSSCTDLKVERLTSDGPIEAQVGKAIYYLPRTAINAAVTVTLKKCSTSVKTKKALTGTITTRTNTLDVDVSVTPVVTTEADPQYRYAVSLEDNHTWLKDINITVGTGINGTLLAFNGAVNDQAGPIIISAATAAIKIAAAVAFPGVSSVASLPADEHILGGDPSGGGAPARPNEPPPPPLCASGIEAALSKLALKKTALTNAQKPKVTKNYTKEDKDADIAKAQAEVSATEKQYKLVRTASLHWVPSSSSLQKVIEVSDIVAKWLNPEAVKLIERSAIPEWRVVKPEFHKSVTMMLEIDPATSGSVPTGNFGKDRKANLSSPKRLVLRQPAWATLRMCAGKCAADAPELKEITDDLAPRQQIAVAQFGQLRIYPEHSALFENANLIVATSADGTITSVADHDSSTAATGFTNAGAAADAYSTSQTARNSAIAAQNAAITAQSTYADGANKALVDCLVQKAAVEKAGLVALPCQ